MLPPTTSPSGNSTDRMLGAPSKGIVHQEVALIGELGNLLHKLGERFAIHAAVEERPVLDTRCSHGQDEGDLGFSVSCQRHTDTRALLGVAIARFGIHVEASLVDADLSTRSVLVTKIGQQQLDIERTYTPP